MVQFVQKPKDFFSILVGVPPAKQYFGVFTFLLWTLPLPSLVYDIGSPGESEHRHMNETHLDCAPLGGQEPPHCQFLAESKLFISASWPRHSSPWILLSHRERHSLVVLPSSHFLVYQIFLFQLWERETRIGQFIHFWGNGEMIFSL